MPQNTKSHFHPKTPLTLKAMLRRLFQNADHFEERSCLAGDDFWLELNHGCHTDDSGNVSAIGVRSNAGSGIIPHLKSLCAALDARLLDIQTSEFADLATDTENSMHAFAEWRDRATTDRRLPLQTRSQGMKMAAGFHGGHGGKNAGLLGYLISSRSASVNLLSTGML